MILLLEPDKAVRKKLCDLLNWERIIGVDTASQTLEMVAKYKVQLNVIIANVHPLQEMLSRQIISRLCKKMSIAVPPIVGYYKNGDEKFIEKFTKINKQCKLIKYNEKDSSFPGQYIQTIREVYPDVHADIGEAKKIWLKELDTEDFVDISKWIEEEGFLVEEEKEVYINELKEKHRKEIEGGVKDIEDLGLIIKESKKEQQIKRTPGENKNYKKMYFELKKKYDELLKYVKELTDSI